MITHATGLKAQRILRTSVKRLSSCEGWPALTVHAPHTSFRMSLVPRAERSSPTAMGAWRGGSAGHSPRHLPQTPYSGRVVWDAHRGSVRMWPSPRRIMTNLTDKVIVRRNALGNNSAGRLRCQGDGHCRCGHAPTS